MAVRHHMFLKNFRVEGVFVELGKVFIPLEPHKYGMRTLFRILITNTSYKVSRGE